MTRIPRITSKELIKAICKMGFEFQRQTGSHKIYKNNDGLRITVPDHAGKIIHPKIIKTILNDTGITVDEFISLL
jgi:predicted RNA binding protein YcfA (HicA-like mRNA interferase family)